MRNSADSKSGERSLNGVRIAYVTSSFPETSMVFEQNEVIGLVAAGVDVTLLSCHTRHRRNLNGLHDFARPLVRRARYFTVRDLARGAAWACTRPLALLSVLARALYGVVFDHRRALTHIGTVLNAVAFFGQGRSLGWECVHANFSQGTATTAWHLSKLLGIPFSFTAHAFDIYSTLPGVREADAFYAAKLKAASKVFTVSEHGRERLVENFGEQSRPKIEVQRVSVRLDDFDFKPSLPGGDRRVLALGRLVEKKGIDDLIRAVGMLKQQSWPVFCEIWGEGPVKDRLVELIAEEQVEDLVRVCGSYRQEQLEVIFGKAQVLAVPSKMDSANDMDGVPTVIYEAMAAGCPVVASRISGIPEIVRHDYNGRLIEPGDVGALATEIRDLICNRDEALDMAARARNYVERHHAHRRLSAQLAHALFDRPEHRSRPGGPGHDPTASGGTTAARADGATDTSLKTAETA